MTLYATIIGTSATASGLANAMIEIVEWDFRPLTEYRKISNQSRATDPTTG